MVVIILVDIVSIGTDMQSDWSFNDKGDLELVSGKDNISQAISNRLSTELNSLLFYNEYGSLLWSFIGWRGSKQSLEFMKIEIENRLLQDPRLREYSVDLEYLGDGSVRIDMGITMNGDEDYSTSLVLSKDGEVSLIGD